MKIFTFMAFFLWQVSLNKFIKVGILSENVWPYHTYFNYTSFINLSFIILGKGENIVFMNRLC